MNLTPVKHWTTGPCTSSESRTLQDTRTHLFFEKVDTTNFCSLKTLVLHNFLMKKQILQRFIIEKEKAMNFCSAKKRTLQSFVMKKAHTANFCSQKKQTLQSLRGTLYNCVLDTTKLYNRHYKAVYYNFGRERDPSAIARARSNIDAKVTCVTNSDTSSFFIPQPPPPQHRGRHQGSWKSTALRVVNWQLGFASLGLRAGAGTSTAG